MPPRAASRDCGMPHTPTAPLAAEDFDICKSRHLSRPRGRPGHRAGVPTDRPSQEVLLGHPCAGLGPGLGSLPRARSELGPFMGVAASIDGRARQRRLRSLAEQRRLRRRPRRGVSRRASAWRARSAMRATGSAFVQIGLTRRRGFHEQVLATQDWARSDGSLTAAIPSRSGLSTRIRMPLLPHPRRPPVAVADVLVRPAEVHAAGRHRQQRRSPGVAAGLGHALRPLPVRPGPRARR